MMIHAIEQQIDKIEDFRAQIDQLGLTGDLDQLGQTLENAPTAFRQITELLDMDPQAVIAKFKEILDTQPELLCAGVFVGYFLGVHDGRVLHEQLGGTQ